MTYYAVLPFVRNDDGELCPDEAIECHSSTAAAARARAIAASRAGAVAFSRTGNPEMGDLADVVIIAKSAMCRPISPRRPAPEPAIDITGG